MNINAKTKICCIIGDPVEHSLSPMMHNAGYEKLNLPYVFVAFAVFDVKAAVEGIRALGIKGVAVTIPHKQAVMPYLDEIDEVAKQIRAVNTIVNKNGKLYGTNTDWLGIVEALKKKSKLFGKKAAVLGAGGAARAAVYGLKKAGCQVLIFNRTKLKSEQLSDEFGLGGGFSLSDSELISVSDIIVNATSVGMEDDVSPISPMCFKKSQVVFDVVYTPKETRLLKDAREKGAGIISGQEMLLECVVRQFELFTGKSAPVLQIKQAMLKI